MGRALRFGLDVGTNSIGWAVIAGELAPGTEHIEDQGGAFAPFEVVGCGARVFNDGRNPKDGSSLAEMRRGPRSARRRRDRMLLRKRDLLKSLLAHGLAPGASAFKSCPYQLRKRALTEPLKSTEVGRVLLHLAQRRGFKSNRRTDAKDNDKGAIKMASEHLAREVEAAGAPTLGAFLADRVKDGVRFRSTAQGAKRSYTFYPTRDMVEHEFDAIWAAQAPHHTAAMTESARAAIHNAIFRQRPLKEVKVGLCTFVENERRAPKALPSVQAREIFETLNALRYGEGLTREHALDPAQRDALASKLLQGSDLSFDQARKALKLNDAVKFSLEHDARDRIKGAATAKALGNVKAFGKALHALSVERQDAIAELLLEEADEETVVATLMAEHGLAEANARAAANTRLPDGYGRLGRTATHKILAELKADVVVYSEACARAGFHHSDFRDGVLMERLPPYQMVLERQIIPGDEPISDDDRRRLGRKRFDRGIPAGFESRAGRISNPTVHIGLNQLRRVVNRLIEVYGQPTQIVVELARELKQNEEQKRRAIQENAKNQKANEARDKIITEHGQIIDGLNRLRLRLWEEQERAGDGRALCPYTLQPISVAQLFSSEVEIDHILPVSQTLDDSPANKVVAFRAANRFKRNRSPYDAFAGGHGQGADWKDIEAFAAKLPRNKAWRFAPDAMARYQNEERDFLARQLNETRYLSRMAKAYLGVLTPHVWVVTGQLTSLLRGKWGLNDILGDHNRKNRNDHRHHAIDAITIACTSRSLLNRVAQTASRAEERNLDRIFSDFPEPMPEFRRQAQDAVRRVVASHKPEHGKGGALHEDTAYGAATSGEGGNLVFRKAIDALTLKDVDNVRCPNLRATMHDIAQAAGNDEKAFTAALRAWAKDEAERTSRPGKPRQPMRHVRLLKTKAAVSIADRRTGEPYKYVIPGENYCVDIVQLRDGKWVGYAASVFEVNQKGWHPQWEKDKVGGKLVMRLRKNDLIELDENGERVVKRVVRLEPSNHLVRLAGANESGDLEARHKDPDDPFRWDWPRYNGLKLRRAIPVRLDPAGCVLKSRTNV